MVQLAVGKNVVPWVTEIPMKEANAAIVDVTKGDPRYRYVFVNEDNWFMLFKLGWCDCNINYPFTIYLCVSGMLIWLICDTWGMASIFFGNSHYLVSIPGVNVSGAGFSFGSNSISLRRTYVTVRNLTCRSVSIYQFPSDLTVWCHSYLSLLTLPYRNWFVSYSISEWLIYSKTNDYFNFFRFNLYRNCILCAYVLTDKSPCQKWEQSVCDRNPQLRKNT